MYSTFHRTLIGAIKHIIQCNSLLVVPAIFLEDALTAPQYSSRIPLLYRSAFRRRPYCTLVFCAKALLYLWREWRISLLHSGQVDPHMHKSTPVILISSYLHSLPKKKCLISSYAMIKLFYAKLISLLKLLHLLRI